MHWTTQLIICADNLKKLHFLNNEIYKLKQNSNNFSFEIIDGDKVLITFS